MKTTIKLLIISILLSTISACNALAPKPTETPTPTVTSSPTVTSTPKPTLTPTEMATSAPAGPPVMPALSGKPVASWEGIRIMPNAIAGQGDSTGYSFTIKATADEIQNFYERELTRLGWNSLGGGQGTTGAILLIFLKGSNTLSVSILPQPDGIMYVMLVK